MSNQHHKISFIRAFLMVVIIVILLIVSTYFITKSDILNYKERLDIKNFISSENLTQIEYEGIDSYYNQGYIISFHYVNNCNYDVCLEESIDLFNKLLKKVNQSEKSSLKNQPIIFRVRAINDSSYGEIELNNFKNMEHDYNITISDYDKIMSVYISDRVSNISGIDKIKNDIQYLSLHSISYDYFDFTQLCNLKELRVYRCIYSDGTTALSDEDITTIKNALPDAIVDSRP